MKTRVELARVFVLSAMWYALIASAGITPDMKAVWQRSNSRSLFGKVHATGGLIVLKLHTYPTRAIVTAPFCAN
jgi:hypothetical protein